MILDELSADLKDLIVKASDEDAPVSDLEFVGLSSKVIASLDESGIIFMKQLITKTKKQLLKLRNIGEIAVEEILKSIENYKKVELNKTAFTTGSHNLQRYIKTAKINLK
jgi:DNA-directed RNA polymerase alpha subunit